MPSTCGDRRPSHRETTSTSQLPSQLPSQPRTNSTVFRLRTIVHTPRPHLPLFISTERGFLWSYLYCAMTQKPKTSTSTDSKRPNLQRQTTAVKLHVTVFVSYLNLLSLNSVPLRFQSWLNSPLYMHRRRLNTSLAPSGSSRRPVDQRRPRDVKKHAQGRGYRIRLGCL